MLTANKPVSCPDRQPGAPWSLRDAAEFLGISPRHLARLIDTAAVKSIKIGRRVFVADAEVRRVAEHGVTSI